MQGPDQRPRNQPEAEMMVAWTRSVAMGKERSGGLGDAEEAEPR